jgi:VWFA-related protein
LQKEDFHLAEDGVEQEIAYFGAVEKPFTVVLMLDTSASTWSKLSQIKDAAEVFVEQLRPDDQVMVVSFGMGVKVQCEPTSDREKIRKAIRATGKGLSTHLYDAMENVMKKRLSRIQGRKALVLFTDGVDATSNHATYETTVHTAEELDALIYPILYDTYDPSIDTGGATPTQSDSRVISILKKIPIPLPIPTIGTGGSNGGGGAGSSRADYDRGERYLRELADLTGGRVYEASRDLRYLRDAFSQIAGELGRQYSIGYYPKRKGEPGARRQIKVQVSRPDVAVRARDKYIYKGPSGQLPQNANTEENKQNAISAGIAEETVCGRLENSAVRLSRKQEARATALALRWLFCVAAQAWHAHLARGSRAGRPCHLGSYIFPAFRSARNFSKRAVSAPSALPRATAWSPTVIASGFLPMLKSRLALVRRF